MNILSFYIFIYYYSMPLKLPKLSIFLILLFSHSFGAGIRCGTANFVENSQKKITRASYSAATFSGKIESKESKPFIIYYTKEGQHAAKSEYINSLVEYLHQAYKLYIDSLGMKKGILGAAKTYYYGQEVPQDFYPVEVINMDCSIFGEVFYPDEGSPRATQIAIENDFNCNVYKKPEELLKVTVFHELYHSFQTAYTAITNNTIFWMEASATGVEEIGAPEVNDYIDFLYPIFRNPGKSMDDLSCDNGECYAYSTLYLFLFSKLGAKFDSAIWSYFSKNPKDKFSMQLARLADSLGYNPENLFHEYARQIFYSGFRANSSSFWEDMPDWPTWYVKKRRETPEFLPVGTFDFIEKTGEEVPSVDFVARVNSLDGYQVWVLSRLLPSPVGELAAYPNPWNPRKNPILHFKLPENANEVEIRTSNGALLERIKREPGKPLDWQPKKVPAPGILYYRILPYGKNKVLILSY